MADAGTASTLSGAITGPGGLTKAGAGTLTLTGANTYSGGTNLNGGTLEALAAGGGLTSTKPATLAFGDEARADGFALLEVNTM